jgi:hypothetical protein
MKFVAIAAAACLSVSAADAAHIITVTWTGTIASGTDDMGVFGAAGTDLTDAAFTSVFTYDMGKGTSNPGYATHPETGLFDYPIFNTHSGGFYTGNGLTPVTSATFALNGTTISVGSNANGTISADRDPLMVFGAQGMSEFNTYTMFTDGVVFMSLFHRLSQDFDRNWASLDFADFDGDVSGDNSPATSNNFGIASYQTMQYQELTLINKHLTISNAITADVPEPASWAMMVGGFGLVGGAMRRRQKTAIRFA